MNGKQYVYNCNTEGKISKKELYGHLEVKSPTQFKWCASEKQNSLFKFAEPFSSVLAIQLNIYT